MQTSPQIPSHSSSPASSSEAAAIDALLPQTQCTRCGFAGCMPYALALARGEAAINRCPPGGEHVIAALAALLGREPLPLDPQCGREAPAEAAWIDPEVCIGCARCLPACPVDAIVGARRYMHTVVEDWCNGCELCIATCPVDCIHMRTASPDSVPTPEVNRARVDARQLRLALEADQRATLLAEHKRAASASSASVTR